MPILGVLSRTLVRSPVIKCILSTRLRDKERHEIALVGERFIHINEINIHGQLHHLGTIDGFDSQIRSAGVVGAEALFKKSIPMVLEESVSEEEVPQADPFPPQYLVVALQEPPELRFIAVEQNIDSSLTFHERVRPLFATEDILSQPGKRIAVEPTSCAIAVAAQERNLVVYRLKKRVDLAREFERDRSQWDPVSEECLVKVDGAILHMEFLKLNASYENHLALVLIVSTRSRLMIQWFIWDLSDAAVPMAALDAGPYSHPLPHNLGPPHLLVPSQHYPTFVMVWHTQYIIASDAMNRHLVLTNPIEFRFGDSGNSRFPAFFSQRPRWTAWSKGLSIAIWDDQGSEKFYFVREDGEMYFFFLRNGTTSESGQMGWYDGYADQAFVCCEVDMTLQKPYFVVSAGEMSPGEVKRVGKEKGNYIIGDTRQITNAAVTVDKIQNWSPIIDMVVSDLAPSSGFSASEHKSAIYGTSGRGPKHGAVVQMNVGYEAYSHFRFADDQFNQITALWAVSDPSGVLFLILSFFTDTILIRVSADLTEIDADDGQNDCDLQRDEPTICAGLFPSGRLVQISRSRVQTLYIDGHNFKEYCVHDILDGAEVIKATIHTSSGLVLLALRNGSNCTLRILNPDEPKEEPSLARTSFSLASEPSALSLFECSRTLYCAVTTTDGQLHILRVDSNGALLPDSTHPLERTGGEEGIPQMTCQSLAVLHHQHQSTHDAAVHDATLLCGMRDGSIISVAYRPPVLNGYMKAAGTDFHDLESTNGVPSLQPIAVNSYNIGVTPVVFTADSSQMPVVAYASCGSKIVRIACAPGGTALSIDEVIPTLKEHPTDHEWPVRAMSLVNSMSANNHLAQQATIVSGNTIGIVLLGSQRKTIPSFLGIGDTTPVRLLYCERLSALIVGSTKVEILHAALPAGSPKRGQRKTFGRIEIISTTHPLENGYKAHILGTFDLWPGERIFCMLDWKFRDFNGTKRALLVVGTGLTVVSKNGDERVEGRLLYLNLRKHDDENGVEILPTKVSKHRSTVYSVAAYSDRDLVVTTTKSVQLLRIANDGSSATSWVKVCSAELRSAGLHVTTSPPYIYVSTAEDSLMVFKITAEKTMTNDLNSSDSANDQSHSDKAAPVVKETLEPVFADRRARSMQYHMPLHLPLLNSRPNDNEMDIDVPPSADPVDHPNVVLMSDKGGGLTGLYMPPSPTLRLAVPTLFEAQLPRSLMRIRQGPVRQPWRRPQPNAPGVASILADDIVGACVDGTVYQLSIIDEAAWKVLKMLEDLAKLHDALRLETAGRYLSGDFDAGIGDDYPWGLAGRTTNSDDDMARYHIDGDVLDKHTGSLQALSDLLGLMQHDRYRGPDASIFEEVTRKLLGFDEGVDREQALRLLFEWLTNVLMLML